ncbi:hypothetical protein H8A97_43275 [Bradyrhizobium sp. Arg62]|uniref:hypothetical protein n=1 Tax=Bradyrhizobium brasilense TaxID=1419277 RepID=UPI001E636C35|nr:hypothetical protein [Bradyrhizobium brasilense]MCC8951665.1 hypothetical protein [Bradyrhizobium brasilense]
MSRGSRDAKTDFILKDSTKCLGSQFAEGLSDCPGRDVASLICRARKMLRSGQLQEPVIDRDDESIAYHLSIMNVRRQSAKEIGMQHQTLSVLAMLAEVLEPLRCD